MPIKTLYILDFRGNDRICLWVFLIKWYVLYMETQPFMMNDILRLTTILWIIRSMDVICGDMISEL